jgi:hypothetical protein
VKNEKIDMDFGEDLEGRTRMRMCYTCKHPDIHQWPYQTLSKWETVEWNEKPKMSRQHRREIPYQLKNQSAKNKGNFEIFIYKIDKIPKSLKTPLAKRSYYY